MKKFFIEKDIFLKLGIISFIILLLLPLVVFIIWLLLISGYLFLFRKNLVEYKDSLSNTVDIVLCPASGKVIDVYLDMEQKQCIRLAIPFLGPYGLYLPFSSEVDAVEFYAGNNIWRGSHRVKSFSNAERFYLEFRNKLGHKTGMHLVSCIFGGKPKIWVKTGDKGRSTASYGYIPFGGSIVITLPKESEVMIDIGEKVKAGITILAGLKGELE